MDFLQLKYFQDAAACESISMTALKYTVPPSCVSAYIKKLEGELGVSLFDRTGNRIKLNNNGKIYLSAVNHAFSELESAKNKLMNLSGIMSGEISLLICTNRRIMTNYIAKFRNDFPQVSFRIEYKNTMSSSDYDIVISDQEIDSKLFDRKILVKEQFKLALAKEHPFARYKSIDIEKLKDEWFISMPQPSSTRKFTEYLCSRHGFSPRIAIESDDPSYIRESIGMGMGVSLVPETSWKGLFPENVILLSLNGTPLYRKTYSYIKKNARGIVSVFAESLNAAG